MDALAGTAAVTAAAQKHCARFFHGLCLDAPFLKPGDLHGGMKGFSFFSVAATGISRSPGESLRRIIA